MDPSEALILQILNISKAKCLFSFRVNEGESLDYAPDVAVAMIESDIVNDSVLRLASLYAVVHLSYFEVREYAEDLFRSLNLAPLKDASALGLYVMCKVEACDRGGVTNSECLQCLAELASISRWEQFQVVKTMEKLDEMRWDDDPEIAENGWKMFAEIKKYILSKWKIDVACDEGGLFEVRVIGSGLSNDTFDFRIMPPVQ
jgi:hypothetical protein